MRQIFTSTGPEKQVPFNQVRWIRAARLENPGQVRFPMTNSVLGLLEGTKRLDDAIGALGQPDSVVTGDDLRLVADQLNGSSPEREVTGFKYLIGMTGWRG